MSDINKDVKEWHSLVKTKWKMTLETQERNELIAN